MSDIMQALYYIALMCDVEEQNTKEENNQWKKANQNRLNQNFSAIANAIEAMEMRISEMENKS